MRGTRWPKHKVHESVQRDVFIVIIVVIRFMSLLGAGTVTLTSGATRSNWRIGTTLTTWSLSTCTHLPLPLSERDVILIGSLLDHLFAGTIHLIRFEIIA
jgi:hypothetical protein